MCLYIDDDDEVLLLSEGIRTARKPHECQECKRTIEPKEQYRFWTKKEWNDGMVYTEKMCGHCYGTIELGAALTGCPKQWYWGEVHNLDEEMGFVGNIIHDPGHSLTDAEKALMLSTVEGRRVQWRRATGALWPIPSMVPGMAHA
jgi:hypothetical protein